MEKKEKEEEEQVLEWEEAQKIWISVDLLTAAKQQLKFLAAVDKNRWLYDGPALHKAIYRYNACWLPLLAKHCESPVIEGPLVVPLDCEWVWHCHRLNPVRYKKDCEEFYGRTLDNTNVVSSIKGICCRQTKDAWNRLYLDEPYDFDLTSAFSAVSDDKILVLEKCSKYDLVSAVKRQSPFFYQVSRAHMNNDVFLEEAVARYKGFLHLIKRNKENSVKRFCVPTYDIDLIWHTHQLHPVSYCKDLSEAVGKILEHDDTDSDRTKGKKLDTGFSGTTKQWEDTFGRRYWKAGAMYRGSPPSPLTDIPFSSNILGKKAIQSKEWQNMIQLSDVKTVEVLVEIVGVKNLPEGHRGRLFVRLGKKQPDLFFNIKRKLTILSESRKKQVTTLQCEPKGDLLFELVSHSPSSLPVTKGFRTLGTATFSLQDFLTPVSTLSVEKWVELLPSCRNVSSKPVCLRIAVSCTVPVQAQHILHMIRSRSLSKSSCFFRLPVMVQHANSWMHVVDETDTEIISFQMRDSFKEKLNEKNIIKKQVAGVMKSGETRILAEFVGTRWSLMDSQWSLQLQKKTSEDSHLFELVGCKMVKIFQGRKLDYEPKHCGKQRSEQDFMTAIEVSAEDPYGKAVALLDLKFGLVKVKEEWLVLPGIILAFILSHILKKKGYNGFFVNEEELELDNVVENANGIHEELQQINLTISAESKVELNQDVEAPHSAKNEVCDASCKVGCGNTMETRGYAGGGSGGGACGSIVKGGGCGSGCGGSCGSMIRSGGCGSGCAGACGNMVESGGCGSGCGGGCRSMVESGGCGGCSGGCGSGCGGGCRSMVESGGCGGCSGGCGSGCGGGCQSMLQSSSCGGCGGGCADHTAFENSVGNSCIDNCPMESPISMNEPVAA